MNKKLFITNFHKDNLETYRAALKAQPDTLYINQVAHDVHGKHLPDYCALWLYPQCESADLSVFWDKFDELKSKR